MRFLSSHRFADRAAPQDVMDSLERCLSMQTDGTSVAKVAE